MNNQAKVAKIIYDWIYKNQVTHRREFSAIDESYRREYLDLADDILKAVALPGDCLILTAAQREDLQEVLKWAVQKHPVEGHYLRCSFVGHPPDCPVKMAERLRKELYGDSH